MKNILITGVSSGLGYALAHSYLEAGDKVYGIGRELPPTLGNHPEFFFFPYDLKDTFLFRAEVSDFVRHHHFDIAILNAGVLGEIQTLEETAIEELKEVMDINVWSNKELIDALHIYGSVDQVVAISSGAAINASKGWGAYALSKNALNMLMQIYAKELPNTHFTALAPGVIKTPMVEHILEEVDREIYPSAQRLAESDIVTPEQAATRLISIFDKLRTYESGNFIDIRTM